MNAGGDEWGRGGSLALIVIMAELALTAAIVPPHSFAQAAEPQAPPAAAEPSAPNATEPVTETVQQASAPSAAGADTATIDGAASQPAATPAPAPVANTAGASGLAACVLGEHAGVAPDDARTAAALVCGALHDKGARVETEAMDAAQAAGYGSAFRVALRPLGKLIMLDVAFEQPVGNELRAQRVQLASIEEVAVAAPRVADALMHGKSLAETAKVDNLMDEETRPSNKKEGETFFAVGVLGFALPNAAWAGYGAFARLHYETPTYAVAIDARLGASNEGDGDASLGGLSVGARYFFGTADLAPFAGGGLGVLWLGLYKNHDSYDQLTGSYRSRHIHGGGIAPFAEAGLELLRMHDSRVDLGLRLDVPLYRLEGDDSEHKRYALPVSLAASYSFD